MKNLNNKIIVSKIHNCNNCIMISSKEYMLAKEYNYCSSIYRNDDYIEDPLNYVCNHIKLIRNYEK